MVIRLRNYAAYFNISFDQLAKQITLTFLSYISVEPLGDAAPQGRDEPLHHHVSGAGGMSARQRLLLHLPSTQLQKEGVLELPRYQLCQVRLEVQFLQTRSIQARLSGKDCRGCVVRSVPRRRSVVRSIFIGITM